MLALPSLKEGWGLVVGEAGMHGTPTVAYRSAGGTRESIADGVLGGAGRRPRRSSSAALRSVLTDRDAARAGSAEGARDMSHAFTWEHAQESFAAWSHAAMRGERVDSQDPSERRP